MLQGWISVHRQIQEHWLWADKPFSKGQAWIDMLMLANHEDKKTLIDNNIVVIESGSFVTSEHKLSERWGWSRWKVHEFLNLLQSDNMISAKTDHRKTTINVINYEKYRYVPVNNQPVTDQSPTTDRPLTDTNNNDNNANNENKFVKESEEKDTPTLEEIKDYCLERNNSVDAERFFDYYSANGWVQGKGKPIKDWKACVRTWERGFSAPKQEPKEKPSFDIEKLEKEMQTKDDVI